MLQNAIDLVLNTYKDSVEQLDLQGEGNLNEFLFRWSGTYALDWVLANESEKGGLVRGQIIEISGPENSGKTTLATLCAVAIQAYKKRSQVLFLDFERKYNLTYAYEFGLSKAVDKLCFVRPKGDNPGEAGLELLEKSVMDPDCGLAIVDSFAAIMSKEEVAGDLTDANIGKTAALQGKGIKNVINSIQPFSPTVLVINQLREIIGNMYGPSEKTSGARALKYYSAIRIKVTQLKKYKDTKGNTVGCRIKIQATKNQVSRNDVSTETDIWFGVGADNISWVMDKAEDLEVLEKKGSKYIWDGNRYSIAQLTEYFSNEKELKRLYILCVRKNNSNVREYLKGLESNLGLKKKLQEASPLLPEPPLEEVKE
jgi:recombination protein RecA